MRILIVDDEKEIRSGICFLLSQSKLSERLEVIGTASDGNEALSIVNCNDIDIVITDIRMPGMSGMELIREVRTAHPHIHIIILSGYDDFGYAREAIRYGALDYLLKPVDDKELIGILTKIVEQSERDKGLSLFKSKEDFRMESEDWKAVVLCGIDYLPERRVHELGGENVLLWMLGKLFTEVAQDIGDACIITGDHAIPFRYMFGLSAADKEELQQKLSAFTHSIHRFCAERIKVPLSLGVSGLYHNDALHTLELYDYTLFVQAHRALFSRVLLGSGIYDDERDGEPKHHLVSERLEAALEIHDEDVIMREIHTLIDACVEEGDVKVLLLTLEKLLFIVHDKLQEKFAPSDRLGIEQMKQTLEVLLWSSDIGQLRKIMMEWMQDVLSKLDPDKQEGQLLGRAKKYIQAHLHHPINLAEVSQETHISPQYLSKLFREKTGETFIEYMTKLRIDEAKRLLQEPGVKVYEVAERVGYSNWKHFSRVFKQYTGYGPSDYKKHS
ncbi:response regulator [Paenibacillus sp. J5C_2022]|uniref:response regulator n=1 Tax=Paenibacillus sp. J5C2022 TaxID=2977129 RepID=UPI0021D16C2E|nr:response regulator [Paenibacillus sp. J5C2022]MCU6711973.1 response regulator [Paenibacillus sp. J5C2022]